MKMKKYFVLFVLLITANAFAYKVKTEVVNYTQGADKFQGLVVKPVGAKGDRPGILMVHNWMGVTDETKKQAERFAEKGYIVFAADIYGADIRPKDPKAAGAEATKYKTNRKLFRERLQLGLAELQKVKGVNTKQLVAAGYCFGGTAAIELARSGADIKGAISFHGGLDSPTPADGKNIKAKIIAFHGAIDPYVPANELAAFETEMNANKIDYQLVKLGGAVHSFTDLAAGSDISKGAAYNEVADKRSFKMSENFLAELF
jgi:dienelactone hydrolase